MTDKQFHTLATLDTETQSAIYWLLGIEHSNSFLQGLKLQTQEWIEGNSPHEYPLSEKQFQFLRISFQKRKQQTKPLSLAMEIRLMRKEIHSLINHLKDSQESPVN